MKVVIGLFDNDEGIDRALDALNKFGFTREQIRIFTSKDEICKLMEKYSQSHLVGTDTLFGAILGTVIFGFLGFLIAFVGSRIFGYGQVTAIVIFSVLTVFGLFLGVVHGYLFGSELWGKEKKLYAKSVQAGDRVIAVQVPNEELAVKAGVMLQQGNAKGIETLDHVPDTVFASVVQESQLASSLT